MSTQDTVQGATRGRDPPGQCVQPDRGDQCQDVPAAAGKETRGGGAQGFVSCYRYLTYPCGHACASPPFWHANHSGSTAVRGHPGARTADDGLKTHSTSPPTKQTTAQPPNHPTTQPPNRPTASLVRHARQLLVPAQQAQQRGRRQHEGGHGQAVQPQEQQRAAEDGAQRCVVAGAVGLGARGRICGARVCVFGWESVSGTRTEIHIACRRQEVEVACGGVACKAGCSTGA